ncbi:MAG: hypothetical protein DRN53_03565 [Thermoprotei archaeon]|nr:MAG: hypothetical protein DRN53_03565 [Thermoprotei archaeon]
MKRPKLAIVYGAICGGCDVALVNLGEKLTTILEKYDIVYWPAVVDFRRDELKRISEVDIGIYMGALVSSEDIELAKLLRSRSKILVAYGTCTIYGGIPGLSALLGAKRVLEEVRFTLTTSLEEVELPKLAKLPELLESATSILKVVEPNIFAPGCPPSDSVNEALLEVLSDYARGIKPKGRIFLGEPTPLCNKCTRKPTDTSKISMSKIRRLHELKLIEDKCFLEQGVLCMGPVTRAACDLPCIKNNLPCVGCNGPALDIDDMGLEMLSALSSLLLVEEERELLEEGLVKEMDRLVDLIGTLYRYTLPSSLLIKLKLGDHRGE